MYKTSQGKYLYICNEYTGKLVFFLLHNCYRKTLSYSFIHLELVQDLVKQSNKYISNNLRENIIYYN